MGGMESCLLGYLSMLSRKGTLDICLLGIPLSAGDFFAGDPPDGILHYCLQLGSHLGQLEYSNKYTAVKQ